MKQGSKEARKQGSKHAAGSGSRALVSAAVKLLDRLSEAVRLPVL